MNANQSNMELIELKQVSFTTPLHEQWTVHFLGSFSNIILMDEHNLKVEMINIFKQFVHDRFVDFKTQVELSGTQILIGFYYEIKEIRLYSIRLGQELFLLEEQTCKNSPSYLQLKNHVGKITNLIHTEHPSMLDIITHKYALPDFLGDSRYFDLEYDLQEVILKLMNNIDEYKPKTFEKVFSWAFYKLARLPDLKNKLLEYLFVILTVDDETGFELKKNLIEGLSNYQKKLINKHKDKVPRSRLRSWSVVNIIKHILNWIPPLFIKRISNTVISWVASRFIASNSIEDMGKAATRLLGTKRELAFDYLGEHLRDHQSCEEFLDNILNLMDKMDLFFISNETSKDQLPRKFISVKLSALSSDSNYYALNEAYQQIGVRIVKILKKAVDLKVFVCFDAELYENREIMLYTVERVLKEHAEFRIMNLIGVTIQAYFRDSFVTLQDILKIAKKYDIELPVRLVKGAYHEEEITHAHSRGWPSYVFLNKEESDLHYRQLMVKILENSRYLRLMVGSHNPLDHAFSEVLRKKYYPSSKPLEHQCLNMTNEALSLAMTSMRWNVRNHIPVGPVLKGLGFLIRRVMENTSQIGVISLLKSYGTKKNLETPIKTHLDKKKKMNLESDKSFTELTSAFNNVPTVKIFLKKNHNYIEQAVDRLGQADQSSQFGDDQEMHGKVLDIKGPECPEKILGTIKLATSDDISKIIKELHACYLQSSWATCPDIERGTIIINVANLLLAKRHVFAACIFKEAGINIAEAYREVDYAIDYLNFHAREQIRLKKKNGNLKSKGVIAVFSAWSSPLASLTCYVSAALASGNVVLIKPAIQTPLICYQLVNLFYEGGLPENVLKCLVPEHKDDLFQIINNQYIAGIAYEGPLNLGKKFYSIFSQKIIHNQLFNMVFKAEAVLSLGGKNGMIVTASADLDMAIGALFNTTLCRSGQMASCPTRIIIDKKIKHKFSTKLKRKLEEMLGSSPSGLSRSVDPIIDQFEKARLLHVITNVKAEIAQFSGTIICDHTSRYREQYIGPLVVSLDFLRACKFESLACSELFGPIIYIIEYDTLENAQHVFNSGEYVRTGSIYSQSSEDVKYLVDHLLAGSIHINKYDLQTKVAVMPQGGFKLSGTGPKMGGKALLYAFMVNYMRESEPEDVEEGRGSDYRFSLMRPSGLGIAGRLLRLEKVMETVIHNFEHLFVGMYGEYKEILIKFDQWIKKDFIAFHLGPHENSKVMGEDNFNDFEKSGEQAVFLVYNPQVEFSTFMRFLGALVMGIGITIIARNEKAFAWWSMLKSMIVKAGISRQNFDVFYPTEELLYQAITEPCLSYIVIDGNIDKIQKLLKVIFMEEENILRFKKILTPHNAPALRDYKQYLSEFVWIRSISVSKKRNGIDVHQSGKRVTNYKTIEEYFSDF
ncbi:MAG: hypothetical protein A2381_10340 [Bdellovibrionales bacterium RIFOXYB1_FULL_37_110]|nr:MAG: hypothetical protein A2417_02855 [Bdellovibrionales bacterium RIFOXYC1_FULL_37_79]OFZ61162.1 MAG: hypothetical protein A2381_10340 [Bdellovibrionales bacterium RIFOXYB1_FULL_37_110]OFZ65613.1 MAG: hypothetical protein A2577_02525 [Bdellovibrionales bacterium RIFOXYD1_FULL_36_51]